MENTFIFVKADLLLHENSFEALRNYINSGKKATNMYSLEYNVEETDIICVPYDPLFEYATLSLIADKLDKGYIFLSLINLKKMLSLS